MRAASRRVLVATLLAGAAGGAGALAPAAAVAQGTAPHVTLGDRDRYSNPTSALGHYEAAVQADPRDYVALTRASVAAVDVGEAATGARQSELYQKGEDYAKRAIAVNPNDAEGHFTLARALGRRAQAMGSRDRVKFAGEVRTHAMEALKHEPQHAGALHIMGMWHAEVMRLSGVRRFAAKTFLGGKVFDSANWDDAQRYLEQAVAAEPTRLIHRIDLAEVLLDRGDKPRARQQIDAIRRAPAAEANDARYKRHAEELAKRL
jgi:tetratricopeptide (TPR) repeat protein